MSDIHAENLFRQQAIQSLRQRLPGRPICLMPRAWAWLSALVFLLLAASILFVCTVEFARKETVRGWLVSSPGVIRIAHSDTARVREVLRQPGEPVRAGDPLVYLSSDSLLPGGHGKYEELLAQLRRDLVEIDSQLELSLQHQALDSGSLGVQLRVADAEIASLVDQMGEHRQQIEVGRDQLRRLEEAGLNGAVSQWDILQQRQEVGTLEQELGGLQQRLANLQRTREAIHNQGEGVPLQSRIERSELRLQRSRLVQQIAEHESRRLSAIHSPVSGTVASVEVHAGNTVAAQTLLMTVLPENIALRAEVYVPSRAAGLIRAGQPVRLHYDAFPRQEFGSFRGRIEHISDFVLLPGDLPPAFPLPEASYKLSVSIDQTQVLTGIGPARLKPGMLLLAEIVLEDRKLLDWLVEPLGLDRGPRA